MLTQEDLRFQFPDEYRDNELVKTHGGDLDATLVFVSLV